jgi:crotonobetainyl-CoA:carnitine CoA-transferase CaiB-like acyl-CoA transferase
MLGATVLRPLTGPGQSGAGVASEGKVPLWAGPDLPGSLGSLRRLPVAGALDAARCLSPAPYPVVELGPDPDPALDWGLSGAMSLTGEAGGPALVAPGRQAAHLRGAAAAFELLCRLAGLAPPPGWLRDAPALLGERAAISGLSRAGRASPGGASRILEAADGWIAVTLSRPADLELLPAWLGVAGDGCRAQRWSAVERALAGTDRATAVERGQLLGIPVAAVAAPGEVAADEQSAARGQAFPPSPFVLDGVPAPASPAGSLRTPSLPGSVRRTRKVGLSRPPLVADLSGLWAGPLCTSLLAAAGARVVKLESRRRPDGARFGPRAFFDLLNAGKESLSLELAPGEGRDLLLRLLERADMVVESSRPRAMEALGAGPERIEGTSWTSITGYGRSGPWRQRTAFGDDAAAASGIVSLLASQEGLGAPVFLADAYADPVSGLHAAVAALAVLVGGGRHVVDVAMREVVAHMLWGAASGPPRRGGAVPVLPPRSRPVPAAAPPLGRDDGAIAAELGAGAGRHARAGRPLRAAS